MRTGTRTISGSPWLLFMLTLVGIALVAFAPYIVDRYYLNLLYLIAVFMVATIGMNILIGYTGEVSLGHAGLMAVGAYVSAYASTVAGIPTVVSILLGIVGAGIIGGAIGYIVLRSGSGVYLALMTIAFGTVIHEVLIRWTPVTGGPLGISAIPPVAIFGYEFDLQATFYFTAAIAIVALWMTYNLRRSLWGRRMLAVKGDSIAARSLGVKPLLARSLAFILSATLAGAAGALYAHGNSYVSPDTFGTVASIELVLMVILGGVGFVLGPVVGTAVLIWLSEALDVFADIRLALYGVIMLIVLYVMREGILGTLATVIRGRGSNVRRADQPDTDVAGGVGVNEAPSAIDTTGDRPDNGRTLLELVGVTKRFGGMTAVDGLNMRITAGTVHALIGPNGAGKSTVLNLVSGHYTVTSGAIKLEGREVQAVRANTLAQLGVARTFQHTRLFPQLTVTENVMVGVEASAPGRLLRALLGFRKAKNDTSAAWAVAKECLAVVGYTGRTDVLGSALSYGQQKLVEIARALATRPTILLLDEPAAGLTAGERAQLAAVLERLKAQGLTIVLVEHHMEFVSQVSEHVTVIDYGKFLADGRPNEVRTNELVIEAYLGPEG